MRTATLLSTLALSGALAFGVAAPSAFAQTVAPSAQSLSIDGALHENDPADGEGRHARTRPIQLRANEGIEVSVQSDAFDPMVRIVNANGEVLAANDDAPGEGLNSRVRFRATTAGTYRIVVTSYSPGETGEYHLEVQRGVTDVDNSSPATMPGNGCENGACAPSVPSVPSAPNAPPQFPGVMPQQPGAMQYPPAPPGFVMISPGVYVAQGYPMPPSVSQPTLPPPVTNVPGYQMPTTAPSWNPGSIPNVVTPSMPTDPSMPNNPSLPTTPNSGGGNVYGIFVGISDYGGANNLDYTANDAVSLNNVFVRRGIIRPENAVLLTDAEATASNVRRAFSTIAQRATDRDTLVFFHDGHGSSNTIVLRSGPMSTSEVSGLLDQVRGQHLLVLDSCYSGSFDAIVRGRPNRLGLFSSTSSEVSYVASEFGAGGYLAYYMIMGVGGGVAEGPDGLRFGDLVRYVQDGYSRSVHGRQTLVVSNGSGNQNARLWSTSPANSAVARR